MTPIFPTEKIPHALSEDEEKIYDIVLKYFINYLDLQNQNYKTTLKIKVGNFVFESTSILN